VTRPKPKKQYNKDPVTASLKTFPGKPQGIKPRIREKECSDLNEI
jgi:hypothetical protein